jgi:DNA-directed RNA polymerase I, II, and III subunit RPABC3
VQVDPSKRPPEQLPYIIIVYSFMSDILVFTARVLGIDLQGKKFDTVSRLSAESPDKSIAFELDYHSDLFSPKAGDDISAALSFGDDDFEASSYSYGMNGKLFKLDEKEAKSTLLISFGGLLMKISCPESAFTKVRLGSECRLLLKLV